MHSLHLLHPPPAKKKKNQNNRKGRVNKQHLYAFLYRARHTANSDLGWYGRTGFLTVNSQHRGKFFIWCGAIKSWFVSLTGSKSVGLVCLLFLLLFFRILLPLVMTELHTCLTWKKLNQEISSGTHNLTLLYQWCCLIVWWYFAGI